MKPTEEKIQSNASDLPVYLFKQGNNCEAYRYFGAHMETRAGEAGVVFRVWAPHAVAISVVGDFNSWKPGSHPMRKVDGDSVWELFIPGMKEYDTSNIEKKLAKRSLHHERQRNLFAIIALVLTAFMITATFSIGFSYFETYQMQQIRLMGTTADVGITNVTENQLVEISKSNLVLDVGIQQRLGSVDTEQLQNARLGIVWIDDTEWEHHRLPTISGVVGNYPSSKNEIMLPTWVLEQMGISDPQIGMEIVLSYQIGDSYNYVSDTFLLSGYYTDYIPMRTNNRGYVYVSSAFKDSLNVSLDNSVTAMIRFQGNDNADKNCERLRREIDFTEGQTFEIVPLEQANGGTIILAVIILAVFISFSGYLLIYNILYVSVVKDVQFYGRLKTIGTTQRQIKRIIYKQAIRISCIGIPIGLLLGAVVSFGIVPYFLNMMYSTNSDVGTKVSFSPFIFIGAAIFTFITVMIASMKPAKIAGNVSPIAALQYTAASTKSSARNCSKMKLSRMAWNNVFRNAKSTTLVFASLFFGLSLFLVVTGLLHGLSPENYVSQWGVSDFALTYSIHEREDLISSEMVSEIGQLDGIENLRLTYAPYPQVAADVVYDDAVFHEFLASLDGVNGIDFSDPAKLENYQQNFFSGVFGIDSAYLEEINKTLNLPIDTSAFEQGKVVLLSKTVEGLIQPGQEITIQTQNGQHSFIVANGYLNEGFRAGGGNERGTAPDLYISQTALKELFPQYRVFRVAFDTDGQHDESILQELKQITASQANIDIISRYERREEMQEYLITAKVLGTGLSVILLLVGVMNFVNTMVVNVNTRRYELAVLESIGMTKRQIKRMLFMEGFYYWGVSLSLAVTIGTAIFILLYMIFSKVAYYAVFSYPFIPLVLVSGLVLLICLIVPIWVYKTDVNLPVVERLRLTE